MVDHEGHVKEIVWEFAQTGEHEGDVFAVVKDYLPEDAPERLLPHAHPAEAAAMAAGAAVGPGPGAAAVTAAAACIPPSRALEAALVMALLGALLAFLYSLLVLRRRRQPDTPAVAADPSAPIILADFPRFPQPGGPSCSNSSFVTKAEAFLRFAGVPYSKQVGFPDPASAPKGQLPYLQRGQQRIGDSHFIIKHLVSSGVVPASLQYPPDPRDKAAAIAVARMCDTDLATALVYYRWVDDEGWARCRRMLLGPYGLLGPVNAVVARMARKSCYTRTLEQGFGRHSEADRLALVSDELAALSQLLGERPFLFGDSPHAVDASAYGVLDQMAVAGMNPQLAALLERHPNLVAYRERIRRQYFGPEYEREVHWVDGGEGSATGAVGHDEKQPFEEPVGATVAASKPAASPERQGSLARRRGKEAGAAGVDTSPVSPRRRGSMKEE